MRIQQAEFIARPFYTSSYDCSTTASCAIPIDNDVFGDPCAGTPKAFAAEVTCAP
ncbi:MAG: hypothetical protein CMH57_14035 [Myxococcales bacterium]|nr:hypothetical protein [Myxococcales bacterium]